MTRVDWIILRRLSGTMLLALTVIFGIFVLLDSLDFGRYQYLAQIGGIGLALQALAISAARWTIRALSITVLVGAILGSLDLQMRQELNVIRASGNSIWRVVRAPMVLVAVIGLLVGIFIESATTRIDRAINPTQATDSRAVTSDGALWLEQEGSGGRYIVRAGKIQPSVDVLGDVTIYLFDSPDFSRIVAPEMRLTEGAWLIPEGTGYRAGVAPRPLADLRLDTRTTQAEIRLRLSSTDDIDFFELASLLSQRISDPTLRNAAATRFIRLAALPLLLMGSVLMAFAFTSGYRRTHKYGGAILHGIVLGFVVFIVTEMANRAGASGVLDPVFAAVGPAFVGTLIGVTVLLYKEDGQA